MPDMAGLRETRCLLLDWGDTVMRVLPGMEGPMCTWPRVEAVAGAAEALTELRLSWTIALATNAADSREPEIRSALARAGLERLFDRVFCLRGVGHRKSEREYFDHVLTDLGIGRERAVMVGDDFEGDVLGANRCGIRAVWFHENGTEERTSAMHSTIHALQDLPAAIERIFVGRSPERP